MSAWLVSERETERVSSREDVDLCVLFYNIYFHLHSVSRRLD
jgi:hypothetical protein